MWISDRVTVLVLLVITCEAMVQLWFWAAPLQYIRQKLIKFTPFLYSTDQDTHLLDCKYCVSVYCGLICAFLYLIFDNIMVQLFVIAMTVHRVSNWLHLVFSFIRDKQFDIRVNRRR
jgi:hypothetical protein